MWTLALDLLPDGVSCSSRRLPLHFLLGMCLPALASAHLLNMTRVAVTLSGQSNVVAKVDLDLSMATGSTEAYAALLTAPVAVQADALRDLGERVATWLTFRTGEAALSLRLVRWTLPEVPPEKIGDVTVAAMTEFEYRGVLAPMATTLQLTTAAQAPIEYPLAISLLIPAENLTVTRWIELPGTASRDFVLPPSVNTSVAQGSASADEIDPALIPSDKTPAPKAAVNAAVVAGVSPVALQLALIIEAAGQYLWLGFLHILPWGVDHILFVLGLYFLGGGWRPLVSQTTAFTVAHTITLGLSAYGVVSLSPRIVEPLIAFSIACVALENIFRPRLSPVRLGVVFGFGLLHGLGFASSLAEVPLPADQFFTTLLAFNFGVDFGQLGVLALAFLAVGWARGRDWYRRRIVLPVCGVIAAIGLFWTAQRVLP